jgi:prephenate dehydrogenase
MRRLAIIGVGLIGGSLARALRNAGAVEEIVGIGRNPAHLSRAIELGVIDSATQSIAAGVVNADGVVICVPVGSMEEIFRQLSGHLNPSTIITDVGSTKQSVIAAAESAFGYLPPMLVPGHPIAGTEQSGVEASFAELYRGRRVILTPTPLSNPQAVATVSSLWRATGAVVELCDASYHDTVLAATSHLPHLLAFALVDALANLPDQRDIFNYAAGGFRDFTRIAASDPTMWCDIASANRNALLTMLMHFNKEVNLITQLIENNDYNALHELFSRAKKARDALTPRLAATTAQSHE